MKELVKGAKPYLLEPVMNIQISTPNEYAQAIINNLVSVRRGNIIEIDEDKNLFGKAVSEKQKIIGVIPL